MEKDTYVQCNDNKIINEKHIRWVKKLGDCLEICAKQSGCIVGQDTHKLCKEYNRKGYDIFNEFFQG